MRDELSKENGKPLRDPLEIPLSKEAVQIGLNLDKVTKRQLISFL